MELESAVGLQGRAILSFRIEGAVCAVVPARRLVALQDDSGAVLLELPAVGETLRAGDRLAVAGANCPVFRNHGGLQVGNSLVVDDDGTHAAVQESGRIYLGAGRQPIQLEWFNGEGPSALKLEYEGPGLSRRTIPDEALWQRAAPDGHYSRPITGLDFAAYNGDRWRTLPDFGRLAPVASGVTTNFNLSPRARDHNTGLVFTGRLEIPQSGFYTFYLTSDDGARLFVGDQADWCRVIPLGRQSVPAPANLETGGAARRGSQWMRLSGVVNFAGHDHRQLELELAGKAGRAQVTVSDGEAISSAGLLHREIQVTGIGDVSPDVEQKPTVRLLVPGTNEIEFLDPPGEGGSPPGVTPETVLTTAWQVRRLRPTEARRGLPAKITGVVTWVSRVAVVVQDSTGGVYVQWPSPDWAARPRVGDYWEVEGVTDPGDFSPVVRGRTSRLLGAGAMPEPIHPTWDQLMNGSLDAEYVELQGVLTSVSAGDMTILTRDGVVDVRGNDSRPLPVLPEGVQDGQSVVGAIVRIRGCLTADWDSGTHCKAGQFFLEPGVVSIDEPRPLDPFSAPTRDAVELLAFDARASALQRTKLAGQIIHARPLEYFMLDGAIGVRFLTREPLPVRIGDLVEVVGFPQLGGPSPVLQEAEARKTGSAPLPAPVQISADELFDRHHDSTLVRLEAWLVSDSVHQGDRLLELQSGARHFTARLRSRRGAWGALSPGARLELTGVCFSSRGDRGNGGLESFELLLNGGADIRVLQPAPWWTFQHASLIVAGLVGGLGLALVWINLLRRKVGERTAQLQIEIGQRQFVEQRRLMEQERTRVAQDLHDELGAGLTEVGILGALARNPSIPPDKKERYLEQLTESAHALVTGLDEIVWAINPHYDSVGSLASYYSLFAQRFLNLAGIACRLSVAGHFPEYPLDSRLRHGIFLAFKEALNNVVRHSSASEVNLRIEVTGRQLLVSVTDNGRGFETTASVPGRDGLAGMRQRIQNLGGECRITSEPGRGATVEFRLQLDPISHDQNSHCRG